jgi:hypothetical protein
MHEVYLHDHDRTGERLLALGFPNLAQVWGLWPTRGDVSHLRARPCNLVVFTINDEFHMLLYAYKGYDAIGTDKPRLMLSVFRRQAARASSR